MPRPAPRTSIAALCVCTAASLSLGPATADRAPTGPRLTSPDGARSSFEIGRVVNLANFTNDLADVRIAPSGKFALVAVDSRLQRVKLTRGKLRVTGSNTAVHGHKVAIAPNNRFAYVVNDPKSALLPQRLQVVNVAGKKPKRVATLKDKAFLPKDDCDDIEVSKNGRWLYVKVRKGIKVFSLAKPKKPKLVRRIKAPEWGGELSMTRDGKRLLSLSTVGGYWFNVYSLAKQARPKRLANRTLAIGHVFTITSNRTSGPAYALSDSNSALGEATSYLRFSAKTGGDQRRFVVNRYESVTDASIWPDGKFMFVVTMGGDNRPGGVVNTRTMKPVTDLTGIDFPRAVSVSAKGPSKGRAYVIARSEASGKRVLVEVKRK